MRCTFRLIGLAGLTSALIPLTAQANSAGRPGADVAEMGCATGLGCHDGEGTSPTVALVVPDLIAPGATVELQVIVDGDGAAAGITAAAPDGTLAGDDDSTKALLGTVTQNNMPMAYEGGQATFTMTWTAPDAEGTYDLFVSANNVNGDQTISGDGWTSTSASLVVGGEGAGGAGGGEGGAGGEIGGAGGEVAAPDGGVDGGSSDDGDDGGCQTSAGKSGASAFLLLAALGAGLRRRRRG